ncbi:DUF1440 domain-containing protein [Isosphaeraceae bacterium EP7]
MDGSDLARGAASGLLATIPMTLAMEGMHAMLPDWERYPLPPRQISEQFERAASIRHELDESQETALTLASHLAYGAGAGAVYGTIAARLPASPAVRGAAFGLGVWAVSYLALMPALGVLSPATEHPRRRTALMIGAHLVWGASAGVLFDRLQRHPRSSASGHETTAPR